MSFCILIPTINQKDLLVNALNVYVKCYPNIDIFILDNGNQDIPELTQRIHVYTNESNLGVAGSWNWLIKKAISEGYEHFLVLNDDVIFDEGEIYLKGMILYHGKEKFHVCNHFYNWSVFILNKYIFDKVGEFDENFKKCFFEDNDYNYRMKLENILVRRDGRLNPSTYNNSMTILKDPSLNGYIENREYYIQKWGGLPDQEVYTVPFNEKIF